MGEPTQEQKRARHAWEKIQAAGKYPGKDQQLYAGEAKKLPIRIRASGLGQALAFLASKAPEKNAIGSLVHDLSDWVTRASGVGGKVPGNLLESVIQGDSEYLERSTEETLAYLQWLNRFAEAELKTRENGGFEP